MKTWKLALTVLVVFMLAGMAAAADPAAAVPTPSLTPGATGLCVGFCYCPKPMPCLTCPPGNGVCVPYCRKPMPCLTCPPCNGICVPYCRKPMPCLCTTIARPGTCDLPPCLGR